MFTEGKLCLRYLPITFLLSADHFLFHQPIIFTAASFSPVIFFTHFLFLHFSATVAPGLDLHRSWLAKPGATQQLLGAPRLLIG